MLLFLADLAIAVGIGTLAAIALTGGGTAEAWGVRVSFRSVGNGLIAIYVLLVVRVILGFHVPFLLTGRSPQRLSHGALEVLSGLLNRLRSHRSRGFLLWLFLLGALVRLLTAAVHPGFFSGDDVEIHEMTFAVLQNKEWQPWDLRSPFYPLGFILPAQYVVTLFGLTEPSLLVFAGRSVVAVASPLIVLVVYRMARMTIGHEGAALAALITASSALLVTFGSTELPRPLSAILVAGACGMLGQTGAFKVLAAGAAIGIAAAMRFSEAIFLVPALLQLIFERRWRDAAMLSGSAAVVGVGVQAAVDLLYWGRAFASAEAIVNYTLVRGLSSRGFQAPWFYFTQVTAWTDYLVLGLAIYGIAVRTWRWALWAGVPILLLSALPHKEPRYLIPVFPFVALLAAAGLGTLLSRIVDTDWPRRTAAAGLLLAGLLGSLLFQTSGMHVHRSDGESRFAEALRRDHAITPADVLLIEQAWRFGGRIYLGFDAPIMEIDRDRLASPTDLDAQISEARASWLLLRRDTCNRLSCLPIAEKGGFSPFTASHGIADTGYVALRRPPPRY